MVVIDTHVLIQDVLEPKRLSAKARRALDGAAGPLAVSGISLWEIAMLIAKGRIDPATDAAQFIGDIVESRAITVLPITPKIAVLAQAEAFPHRDPADRIIAATAIVHGAQLVTADERLHGTPGLRVLW
ncbi:MAG: type II toxin-antitoxin system VapC family toxin [Betaproteobacteria bacterium]